MSNDSFRRLIEQGDVEGVRRTLARDATLANRPIRWHLNQDNEADPLHYVSDCVSQGWLTNGREGEAPAIKQAESNWSEHRRICNSA
jgi:hypothetical protein